MSNPNYSGELPPSFRGRGEEAWQVHKYSVVYPDHFLISPGNIKSREEKRVLLQIEVQMDGRSVHLPCISNGRDNAYFIERGRSYKCTLSAIITDLSQQGFKGIVHWLACSEICHNEDEMRELAEAIKIDKPTDVMKGETSVSAFRRMFEKK
jgi:hypothetical protein